MITVMMDDYGRATFFEQLSRGAFSRGNNAIVYLAMGIYWKFWMPIRIFWEGHKTSLYRSVKSLQWTWSLAHYSLSCHYLVFLCQMQQSYGNFLGTVTLYTMACGNIFLPEIEAFKELVSLEETTISSINTFTNSNLKNFFLICVKDSVISLVWFLSLHFVKKIVLLQTAH